MSINIHRPSTGHFSVFHLHLFRLPAAALALAITLLALPLSPLSTAWAAEPPAVVNIQVKQKVAQRLLLILFCQLLIPS